MFTLLFTPSCQVGYSSLGYLPLDCRAVLIIRLFSHHSCLAPGFLVIWPDRADLEDAWNSGASWKVFRIATEFAKYPLENKLTWRDHRRGLSVILTGVFMMSRVRTIFFPHNPHIWRQPGASCMCCWDGGVRLTHWWLCMSLCHRPESFLSRRQ
jgi:hypothetical protein